MGPQISVPIDIYQKALTYSSTAFQFANADALDCYTGKMATSKTSIIFDQHSHNIVAHLSRSNIDGQYWIINAVLSALIIFSWVLTPNSKDW